ncbi:Hypothetical protein NTJ_12512 [Nesidiocoris tenuis]|uniref:Uncharacterized protein n=1 Tax=Nesidiocoris tenuis TaxID=355587 RepID=A0ABN7B5K5_9HEMI|nr:Hypothetical protein NTJ_12512 [Nesidiocoris tenuis]
MRKPNSSLRGQHKKYSNSKTSTDLFTLIRKIYRFTIGRHHARSTADSKLLGADAFRPPVQLLPPTPTSISTASRQSAAPRTHPTRHSPLSSFTGWFSGLSLQET